MEHIQYVARASKSALIALMLIMALTVGGLTVTYAARNSSDNQVVSVGTAQDGASALQAPQYEVADTGLSTSTQPASSPTSATAGQISSSPTPTATPTATPTHNSESTATSTSTPTSNPSQSTSETPEKALIEGFPALAQSYSLSCEYAASLRSEGRRHPLLGRAGF